MIAGSSLLRKQLKPGRNAGLAKVGGGVRDGRNVSRSDGLASRLRDLGVSIGRDEKTEKAHIPTQKPSRGAVPPGRITQTAPADTW